MLYNINFTKPNTVDLNINASFIDRNTIMSKNNNSLQLIVMMSMV